MNEIKMVILSSNFFACPKKYAKKDIFHHVLCLHTCLHQKRFMAVTADILLLRSSFKSVQDVQERRDYPCSDINMLRASMVICSNFKYLLPEILIKRPIWANPYITDVEAAVLAGYTIIGINPKLALREAVFQVTRAQSQGLTLLGDFKIFLEEDFKKVPKLEKYLKDLGFISYWEEANVNKSQSALMQLMITFKDNCTQALITEFEAKGMTPGLCAEIIALADPFIAKEAIKDPLKDSTKILTANDIKALNDIYFPIGQICNICQRIFMHDKVKEQMFSFRHILRLMEHQDDTTPPVPPQE